MVARKSGAANAVGATAATGAVRSPGAAGAAGAAAKKATTSSTATTLDRLIHDRTRLAILSALAVNESLSFNELKAITGTTDGNLSVHARKLEEAGYVACEKTFAGRTPRTDYRLSTTGRRALERYLDHMDALIRATRSKG